MGVVSSLRLLGLRGLLAMTNATILLVILDPAFKQ